MKPLSFFSPAEFKCKCCGEIAMDDDFLRMLDRARGFSDVPFFITSGYRCPRHNAEVGSTSTNHTRGLASDIRCTTGPQRIEIVGSLIQAGFRRIGIGKDYVHVDCNTGPESIWLY